MRFSTLSIVTIGYLAAASFANPMDLESRSSKVCNKIEGAMCCSVSEFGVANVNCESVKSHRKTHNLKKFKKYCGKKGKEPACCTVSQAGDGLVCHGPGKY
ncbi:hypothetical protein VTL71DRAFT_1607 [Oculimacula yallundae]|uniref:Uncharacterized protein n=1 Tax=Oculimacula yallundae TaxID=86028 RepID=A0ABR4CB62_9HELO